MQHVEALIIGGGQAGLTMSHCLTKRDCPHLVLERGQIAERWRSERWEGLHFQTPNALVQLPDFPLRHPNPSAFATWRGIADFIAAYAQFIAAPVQCGVEVIELRQADDGNGFIGETPGDSILAQNVVVATGPFQRPIIPSLLADAPGIQQLHAAS